MVLTSKDTKFIFVVTSTDATNPRFEKDTNLAITLLMKTGVELDQFIIVSDADNTYFESLKYPAGLVYVDSTSFMDKVKNIDCKNLIVIVNSHGHYMGIPAKTLVSPSQFTYALQNNGHLENVIALFGQCYAGAFNYEVIESDTKKIVYIGATEMDSSISTYLAISKAPWSMNTFTLAAILWMTNPLDVDGDTSTSVMDMYKYISYYVNRVNSSVGQAEQKKLLTKILDLHEQEIEAKKKGTLTDDINQKAEEAYKDMILTNQRPWILNARVAHSMEIQVK